MPAPMASCMQHMWSNKAKSQTTAALHVVDSLDRRSILLGQSYVRCYSHGYAMHELVLGRSSEWVLKGEGNANAVFAYAGTDSALVSTVLLLHWLFSGHRTIDTTPWV